MCTKQRHIPSLVAHALFLLEGPIVLFVDDDQTQARNGAKMAERAPMATRTRSSRNAFHIS